MHGGPRSRPDWGGGLAGVGAVMDCFRVVGNSAVPVERILLLRRESLLPAEWMCRLEPPSQVVVLSVWRLDRLGAVLFALHGGVGARSTLLV